MKTEISNFSLREHHVPCDSNLQKRFWLRTEFSWFMSQANAKTEFIQKLLAKLHIYASTNFTTLLGI